MRQHFASVGSGFFCLMIAVAGCSGASESSPPEDALPPRINAPPSVARQALGVRGLGVRKDGTTVSVDPGASTLTGVDGMTGQLLGGIDYLQVRIPIRYEDGSADLAEVTDWKTSSTGLDSFILRTADGANLCGSEAGAPIWATVIPTAFDLKTGRAGGDPSLYTLACWGGVLARCVDYGFAPWQQRLEAPGKLRDLDAYHAACVAMLRADYCGDGQAHSLDGTAIDFHDALGVHLQESHAPDPASGPWLFEAEWTPRGAWCIQHTRYMAQAGTSLQDNQSAARNPDWAYVQAHCPERIAGASIGESGARPCGERSTLPTRNGYDIVDQTQRSLLASSSPLYRYPRYPR